MEDILDEFSNNNNESIYTNISLVSSFILICCLGFIFSYIPAILEAQTMIIRPPQFIVWITYAITIFGVVMTIISFRKGEPSSWKKWLAAIVNISIFILIIGSISMYSLVGIEI